jgi:hypothetical protein
VLVGSSSLWGSHDQGMCVMGPKKEAYDDFMAAVDAFAADKKKTDPAYTPSKRLRRKAHRLWTEAEQERQAADAGVEAARESDEAQAGLIRQVDT